ncbi:MAG TPA: hypothetical protein PK683_14810, partial [Leptospiraceae bacterium]|nr:hypothetical protein [Leptospiraceae bacterium]
CKYWSNELRGISKMKIVILSILVFLNCGGKSYYQICRSDCSTRSAICLVGFLPQQSSSASQDTTSKTALAAFLCDDYYSVCLRSCYRTTSSSSSSSTR